MTYRLDSKNAGTVEVIVAGDYRGTTAKDIAVVFSGGDGFFEEIDDADLVMQWLVDNGVEFESDRSMAFNRDYIQSVLLDGDATEGELLDEVEGWTDEDIERKLQFIER